MLQPSKFQARLLVTKEVFSNGAIITDLKSIQCSAKLVIYKLDYNYPPLNGSLKLTNSMKQVMSTYKGTYTTSSSAIITEEVIFLTI